MNLIYIVPYVLIGCMFIFTLLATSSTSQFNRSKLMKGYYATGILFLVAYIASIMQLGFSFVVLHFLAFGIVWPLLIGRLISQQRTGLSLVQLRPVKSVTLSAIVSIIFLIGITSLFMLPNKRTYPEGIPIYDADYVYSRISCLLMAIPAAILFFIIAIQRTIIHTGGISISGVLWAWGDFQAYEWGENTRQKLTVQLHIKTDYRVPIKLVIPVNYKQQIEEILTKNLKI